jgi:adenylosuccinate synthase
MARIVIVQGGQYGSEAKGMVAAALTERRNIDICVRTGAVNAGHTVYYKGAPYKMQQLPTGWVRPGTQLVLGAGAYIDPDILDREITMVNAAIADGTDVRSRLTVDVNAGLHEPIHAMRSAASGRHHAIGATGKGCSESIIDRIRGRGKPEPHLFAQWLDRYQDLCPGIHLGDTARKLNRAYDEGAQILLEGTQGTELDLYYGPYPYTTHKQCLAGQWPVEAGLSPGLDYEIIMCVRTYPIRVAGNSGPLPNEISWVELARSINYKLDKLGKDAIVLEKSLIAWQHAIEDVKLHAHYPVPGRFDPEQVQGVDRVTYQTYLSEVHRDAWEQLDQETRTELARLFEFTTVTHKLRRIGMMDLPQLKRAVMLNRPSWLCLTFLNYQFPELWGATVVESRPAYDYILALEDDLAVQIGAFTTGPESTHFLDRYAMADAVGQ